MPNANRRFTIETNLHSDDWAGQVGSRRDPYTLEPIDGVIYDCNQHGHTVRPWVPPRTTLPNAAVEYHGNSVWTETPSTLIRFLLPTYDETWNVYQLIEDGPFLAYLGINWTPDKYDATISAGITVPGIFERHYRKEHCNTAQVPILPSIPYQFEVNAVCYIELRNPIPATPAQQNRQRLLADAARIWNRLSDNDRQTWGRRAQGRSMTAYNAFVKNYFSPNPLPNSDNE